MKFDNDARIRSTYVFKIIFQSFSIAALPTLCINWFLNEY